MVSVRVDFLPQTFDISIGNPLQDYPKGTHPAAHARSESLSCLRITSGRWALPRTHRTKPAHEEEEIRASGAIELASNQLFVRIIIFR